MNPLMTRHAERHQIAFVMCATVGERSDVMHKRRENISALLFAHLTERMPCQMSVTNPAPRAAIPFVLIVVAREVVVMSLHHFFVRLTVTAFPVGKIRTARHAAGSLRLSRHRFTSIKKALTENYFSAKADSISYFC